MVLALSVGLGAGCKSPTPTAAGRSQSTSSSASTRAKPKARAADPARVASAHAHYAAGIIAEMNGDAATACDEFQRAVTEDPDDEALLLDVTRRLLQKKRAEKALEFLRATTARGNVSGEIYARLGHVHFQLGHVEEAIRANRLAIQKAPQLLTGYQNLFLNLLVSKQNEEAIKLLDTAAAQEKAAPEFLLGLADLYQNYAQQFPTQRAAIQKKSLATLQAAAAQKPADPQLRLRLADGFYTLGETQRAAEIYLPLLPQLEDLPLLLENVRAKLAEFYLRSDDRAHAREQLEAIVRADPANAQAHYFLASIAYDEKRWAVAAEHLRTTLLLSPQFEQAHYDLAAAQLALEDAPGALATLAGARARFAQNFIGEYLSAMAEIRGKNFSAAVKHFVTAEIIARATEPKRLTAEFYFDLGSTCERAGDREEAAKQFEKALKLKPEFPEAQNYLGYMWAERGENLERARDLIAQALKAEPKSAAYLDSMAWVLFKLNQPQAALEYLLKAVAESENPDATLYDHLGDIYSALNQADKARAAWQKSLTVDDTEAVRKKLNSTTPP